MLRRLLPLLVLLSGCAHPPSSRDTTNAILWVQASAEYEVAVRQSYVLAARRLDEALAAAPAAPAVVMDLDETVLDNSGFEAGLIRRDEEFALEAWHRWLAGTGARAMPGAVEFVAEARRRGAAVLFVTNRHERYRAPTLATLQGLGLAAEGPSEAWLLMRGQRPEWGTDKASRREAAAAGHAVVLLVGDDLNDFVPCLGLDPPARKALVAENAQRFGREWVLVPSPSWGSWLDALHGYREDLSPAEMRELRLRWLKPDEAGSR